MFNSHSDFIFFLPCHLSCGFPFWNFPDLLPATANLSFAVAFFAGGQQENRGNLKKEKTRVKSDYLYKSDYSQFLGMLDSVQ